MIDQSIKVYIMSYLTEYTSSSRKSTLHILLLLVPGKVIVRVDTQIFNIIGGSDLFPIDFDFKIIINFSSWVSEY